MKLNQVLIRTLADTVKYLDLKVESIQIAPSKNPAFGDLSTNLALIIAKGAGKNPLEIAKTIKDRLVIDHRLVSEVTVTPPGFINFRISDEYFQTIPAKILGKKGIYSRGTEGVGQTANVEFVSANPTGPLTVGHGRQAVLGDTIANILEWHGYNVTREYYYNDAGRQMRILAQSVEVRYFQHLGQNVPLPEDGYQGEYLVDIAKTILSENGDKLKPGNPVFREVAEKYIFNDIKSSLSRLGIVHDRFSNEQTYYDTGAIDTLINDLQDQGLVYKEEGATWFKTTALGKKKDRVLIKSTGEPTYRLPDMAYHRDKLERGFDLIVDIFGADHIDTYPDVLAALEVLNYDITKVKVLIHQFVTLVRSGEKVKMSTRKANFVTLEDLVNEVGPDVVRYFFIMRGMNSHLNFDLDLAADQSEKNPVFYLQYAHARISNILSYGKRLGHSLSNHYDAGLLTHPAEINLIKKLDRFPDTMDQALKTLEPQIIANYLHSLAASFHKFYTECKVIMDDKPVSQARLALVSATQIILAQGLGILGIRAPEKM